MKYSELHLIDTVVDLPTELVVILKDNPSVITMIIPYNEIHYMTSLYKKYNHVINYNGKTWYLNNELYELLLSICNDINNIGITYRHIANSDINNKLVKGIKDIFFINCDLSVIQTNENKDIDKLIEDTTAKKIIANIQISQDDIEKKLICYRICITIIEFLHGFKIKNNTLTDIVCNKYEDVYLYTFNKDMVNYIENIDIIYHIITENSSINNPIDIKKHVKIVEL